MVPRITTVPGKAFSSVALVFAVLILFVAPSIARAGDTEDVSLTVYVVNYPLKYFAQRIAGSHANVVFPAPADEDPAFWNPDPETIAAFQKADLILLNGAGYARWVDKTSLPRSKVLDTSVGFKERYIKIKEAVTHSHGAEGKHAHEDVAFTTWIDFDLAGRQARAIGEALSRMRPDLQDELQRNYVVLAKDLKEIDKAIQKIVSANPTQPLIGSHPVYDYFARRYGLTMKCVHWEPDEVPSQAQWAELRSILKGHPAKWMIWEGRPMQGSVDKLESEGIKSLVFDPCANVPDQGDFLGVMRQNVENLKKAFP
jgi:zinc transport system substrate-binding protein